MKTWLMAALIASTPATAGNTWIMLHDGKNEQVTELRSNGAISALAQSNTLAFGESSTQIALVSYEQAAAQNQLRVLDKRTRTLVVIWPVPATPVSLLSGAAPDIVLLDDVAYLLTHSTTLSGGTQHTRNERGGRFNVVRIELRTGEVAVLPLGDAFANPRLSNYDGVPVVTDWAGYAVWRLAPGGKEMTSVIGPDELSDILPAERTDQARRNLPYNARADYVAVPGAGVFRMSKFGLLHRVAGPDLAPLPAPHASIALGPAQYNERLLAVTSEKGPAIAVVRNTQEKRTLAFIDAATLDVVWERELPSGISPASMVPAGPNSVLYIDHEKGTLLRTTRDGTAVVRNLPSSRYYNGARILSAGKL